MILSIFLPPKPSGPDFRKSKIHTILISKHELTIEIPGNESRDWGPITIPQEIVSIEEITSFKRFSFRERHGLLAGIWDYFGQKGRLKNKEIGHIHLDLAINKIGAENSYSSNDIDSFIRAIHREIYQFYEGENGKNTETRLEISDAGGDSIQNYLVNIPDLKDYQTVDINGRKWIKFPIRGETFSQTTIYYATPISPNHYLSASFLFRQDGGYRDPDWPITAERDMERIVSTIRLKYVDE